MTSRQFKSGSLELVTERLRGLIRQNRATRLRTRAMTSPFPLQAEHRLLLVSLGKRIPQSQIFPFHFFAADLQRHYGAAVREVAVKQALRGRNIPTGANIVAFQTDFDIDTGELAQLVTHLRQQNPGARMVYLDWTAPTDLRNAERLNSLVDVYVKKHVLRDRGLYGRPTLGDTNLCDYYARRAGLPEQEYCFRIPPDFMGKLLVGPSFVTAPALLPALRQPFNARSEREIDLHARFDASGTPWYGVMRGEAEAALAELSDVRLAAGFGIPRHHFINELRHSKVCFSPFGYGEVCWRDYEAVMAGAMLLKPDTGHVETHPDIFRPWETYVPLRWDLADLNDTLRRLLKDSALRESIAERAYAVLHDYVHSDAFARQMQPLFAAAD